jgi:hypothetical protein
MKKEENSWLAPLKPKGAALGMNFRRVQGVLIIFDWYITNEHLPRGV